MDYTERYSYILGGRSLESRVEELFCKGKTENEIAKELNVSLRYVHTVLKTLKRVE